MQLFRKIIHSWLKFDTYTRLFLPILLLFLAVSAVRYHLLIEAETAEANERIALELRQLKHYLTPALANAVAPVDEALLAGIVKSEVQSNPDLEFIRWQSGRHLIAVHNPLATAAQYPRWFAPLVRIDRSIATFSVPRHHEETGELTVQISPVAEINRLWRTVATQLRISGLIILTVYLLLALLLRANARMLKRLSVATNQFKSGDHGIRMTVAGALEARALAQTFNSMADEVQSLVKSLQESERQQREQLHFTRQLIDVLPLPVYVRNADGDCLSINRAWEQLVHIKAADVVGRPMHGVFGAMPQEMVQAGDMGGWRPPAKEEQELQITTVEGRALEVIYYKAAFTSVDGNVAGTIGAMVDITERKQAQGALLAEKERAEVTLSSIGDAVITTDLAGRIETINEVAQHLTGWTGRQAQGSLLDEVFELLEEVSRPTTEEAWTELYKANTVVHAVNQTLIHQSGERYAIDYTAAPIRKSDGTAVGCVLVFRDVSEKRQLIQQISWQGRHDVLTGLHNRAALAEQLTHAIFQARQCQKLLAVCLLDLDHFQTINERYGTRCGDRLLKEVAARLGRFAGDDHGLARMGGDEFVLLLGNQSDLAAIENRVSQMLSELSAPYAIDDKTIVMTASIGAAIYPHDDVNPDTLLRHADQAMYLAKQTGRNRFHVFDARLDQQVQTHHNHRTRVWQALRDGELRLHYQPKVNMRSGKVVGMEALLRWQHPEKGILGPFHFLPQVENTDLIIDIGEWVLHEALGQMKHWAGLDLHWIVSVNIAARHFQRPDFVSRLKGILDRFADVSPRMLELEILESAALEDVQHMRNVMASCQELGVKFALDDFGTGYSSLSYLKRLPADTLKIDQTFVRNMLDDQEDLTLVSAIVGLAKSFDRHVIAEGVETADHGMLLLQLGCDLAQGYGIARPMAADAVAAWAAGFVPPVAWNAWGTMQWEQADFPLLLALHDQHGWVTAIVALADTSQPANGTPSIVHHDRFGEWYGQRGRSHYGHLHQFTAVGLALKGLRSKGLEIERLHEEGQFSATEALVAELTTLNAEFGTHLAALLSAAAGEKAEGEAIRRELDNLHAAGGSEYLSAQCRTLGGNRATLQRLIAAR